MIIKNKYHKQCIEHNVFNLMCRVFNSRIRLIIMFRTVFAFASLQNKYNNLNAKIALMKFNIYL